jgi:hypothetical protein
MQTAKVNIKTTALTVKPTVRGAFSLLLTTTVFPAAKAGAAFFAKKRAGTFHGMIAAT